MDTPAEISLFAGKAVARWPGKAPSAIGKSKCSAPSRLTRTGLAADEQADLKAHGGFEKALYHYPADHYSAWKAELGENARFQPGGFGENISTLGMSEADVCIGDIFSLGTARIQISQGRQPCWKLTAHTGEDRLAYLVRKTLRTGWYYRVLEEGDVTPGDALHLIERLPNAFSVRDVTAAFFNPRLDPAKARALSEIAELFVDWRKTFASRAG